MVWGRAQPESRWRVQPTRYFACLTCQTGAIAHETARRLASWRLWRGEIRRCPEARAMLASRLGKHWGLVQAGRCQGHVAAVWGEVAWQCMVIDGGMQALPPVF